MAYDHLEIEARWRTILGEDNERMSKSRGNVVDPDDIVGEYGADALRLYQMSRDRSRAIRLLPLATEKSAGITPWRPPENAERPTTSDLAYALGARVSDTAETVG